MPRLANVVRHRKHRPIAVECLTFRNDFPQEPEKRFEVLLDIVNAETKSTTLLLLSDEWQSSRDLLNRWSENMLESASPDHALLRNYCHSTFLPNGVAEENDVPYAEGTHEMWRISPAGRMFGLPAAVFSLTYVAKSGRSLSGILGRTHLLHARAPYRRVRILEELEGCEKSAREISYELSMDAVTANRHLRKLMREGLVVFETVGPSGSHVYKWKEEGVKCTKTGPLRLYPRLTEKVCNYLKEHGSGDVNEIADALGYPHMNTLSVVLVALARHGLTSCEWDGWERSRASITPEGSAFLREYVGPLREISKEGDEALRRRRISTATMLESGRVWEYASEGARLYMESLRDRHA